MENVDTYLRRMAPKSQEYTITRVNATDAAALFASGLTGGFGRAGMFVYNHSLAASGECYFGPAGVTPDTGIPLTKDLFVEIPITDALDVYFVAETGEDGDLRVLELS
jgi:hypothetical protein